MIDGGHDFQPMGIQQVCTRCKMSTLYYYESGRTCQDEQEINARRDGKERRRDGSYTQRV